MTSITYSCFSHIAIVLLIILITAVNLSQSQLLFKKGAPHVKLNQGLYTGQVKISRGGNPYYEFLGLRYANPPKRFQPTVLYSAGTGSEEPETRNLFSPGNKCPQNFGPNVIGDEDCLFLNVYVPMKSAAEIDGHPIMFWIHGGSFTYFSGDSFDPQYFIDEDVIIVTINYRLGALGFLSTDDDVVPGNMGLKDQVLALQWVQNNIKHFGGDNKRVTIFGNSAGAASVHYLMLSPLTKGLFHSAIVQSGSVHSLWAFSHNPLSRAEELGSLVGCKNMESTKQLVTCLESKSTQEIIIAQSRTKRWFVDPITPFGPTVEVHRTESTFLAEYPETLIERREFSRVPLMAGIVQDEGLTVNSVGVMISEKLRTQLAQDFHTIAPITFNLRGWFPETNMRQVTQDLKDFYFGDKQIDIDSMQNLTNLYSDANFVHGVWKLVLEHATEKPVYAYVLSFQDGNNSQSLTKLFTGTDEKFGVAHGDELQYLFKCLLFPDEIPKGTEAERFSFRLVKLWASFARHRKPIDTWGSASEWPPISKSQLHGDQPVKWYLLDADTKIIDDPFLSRKIFWDKLFKKYVTKVDDENAFKDEL